jgi:hypothetical protein
MAQASGMKTYIVLALAAAVAVFEGVLGIDVPGANFGGDWLEILLGAGTIAGLRSAMSGAVLKIVADLLNAQNK